MEDKFIRSIKLNILKKKIDLRILLKRLDIDFKDQNNELWAKCPFHDENTPSWSINNDKTSENFAKFKCFGCGEKGDWIKLVMYVKELNESDAINYVKALFGIGNINETQLYKLTIEERKNVKNKTDNIFIPEPIELPKEFLKLYKDNKNALPYWNYIISRNITPEVILDNNLMYCYKAPIKKEHKRYRQRVIIPITYNNIIVSFFARSIDPGCDKKYRGLYPPNSPIRYIMLGYDQLDYNLDYCIVCEGPIDKLRLESLKYKNVLGNLGNQLTDFKKNIISRFKKIWVIPDADSGGEILEQYFEMLKFKHEVYVNDLPDGEDPGSANPKDIWKGFVKRRKITEAIKDYKIKVNYNFKGRKRRL